MDQYPEGQRALNDIEAARVRANLRMFFPSEVQLPHTPEEIHELQSRAIESLADALVDPATNNSTAEILLKRHIENDVSVAELYAYNFLITRTRDKYPDSVLPSKLLSFIQEQAQDHGETDIAFEMIVLLSDMDDAKAGAQAEPAHTPIREIATSAFIDALSLTADSDARVADQLADRQAELNEHSSEQHFADRELIINRVDNPQGLLQDIMQNRFRTPEGLAAAKAQHDNDRLAQDQADIVKLRLDLSANRFLTVEGIAEARRRLDLD